MVPVCAIGFFKYQGQSLIGIIREILYSRRTEKLAYSAGEYRGQTARVFSAGRMPGKRPKDRRRKKRKEQKEEGKNRMKKERKGGAAYGSH
jgi:hypothetical protein